MLVSFVLGMMATALAEDELLLEARLPLLAPDTRFGFYEFSRRAGDYALAMALVTFRLQDGASRRGSDRRRRGAPQLARLDGLETGRDWLLWLVALDHAAG